jgi:hypothetical protein
VVGTARSRSFFPDIYNEDWFYLLDAKMGLQPLAASGEAIQRPYDPFRTPDRARAEELGDVLAEGTFWLLDQGRSVADADEAHWAAFLNRRGRFIVHVLGMVERFGRRAGREGAHGRVAEGSARPARLHHAEPVPGLHARMDGGLVPAAGPLRQPAHWFAA